MQLTAGARLGPYEILAPLGAGGMGEVYRARDTRLAREVAIKVLPARLAEDSERLKRFEKEARSASGLNHPNIVTIYDIGQTDGVSWIAMELVDGKTVRELLTSGALPVKRLLQLATAVAEGLAKAHEAGIVHRDLKPENLMVTRDGLVKILDFGLAKLSSTGSGSGEGSQLPTMTGTTPGVIVGTVGYMSPEQASAVPIDFRSDQFALGSILYEMATGRRAFQKKTAVETLTSILNEEPEPIGTLNPQIPAPLRWLVERCLAKESRQRYSSTEDLARELATIRDHLSEASTLREAVTATPASRLRWGSLLALAAMLALTVGGFFFGKRTNETALPTFQRLTFRRGLPDQARFTPDGQTVVYSAAWEGGPVRLYSMRLDSPESRPLDLPPADLLSVSSSGEVAILLDAKSMYPPNRYGTLARVPLLGGAPREVLEGVHGADWSPDGRELAVIRKVGDRRRLEFPIGKTLYEGGVIWSPRVSPSGDRVAFLEILDDVRQLCTVDRTGKKQTLARDPGFLVAWSRSGDEVWSAWNDLEAVSLSGHRRVLTRFPKPLVGSVGDISRDGRVLVTLGEFGRRIVGLPPGETRERELSWLGQSRVAELSGDGTRLLFTDWGPSTEGAVYLRTTDGSSSPVRLAEGANAVSLSRDSKWALVAAAPSVLELVPTGAGEKRILKVDPIEVLGASFFPDGKRIVIEGQERGRPLRSYVQDLEGGSPRAITPEGVHSQVISPDGRMLAARDAEGRISLYPVEGGAPRAAPGSAEPGELSIWSADGRSIFVTEAVGEARIRVFRRDVASGQRELWKEIAPADPAGILSIDLLIAPNGSYAYTYNGFIGNLYLMQGLK